MTEHSLKAVSCVIVTFIAVVALACGSGNSPLPPPAQEPHGGSAHTYAYVPYVDDFELIGELVTGAEVSVVFSISLPDNVPESLYIRDALDPIDEWYEGTGYADVTLWSESYGQSSTLEYDGSGQITRRLLVPAPGEYELLYYSARSPEQAGEYPIETKSYNPALTLQAFSFTVPSAE
ncbi:hypothetical protein J7J84_05120 [bacterium]|nr:hypothetical protein [bacterium]